MILAQEAQMSSLPALVVRELQLAAFLRTRSSLGFVRFRIISRSTSTNTRTSASSSDRPGSSYQCFRSEFGSRRGGINLLQNSQKVIDRSGQVVERPDHDDAALAEQIEHTLKFGAIPTFARSRFLKIRSQRGSVARLKFSLGYFVWWYVQVQEHPRLMRRVSFLFV